MHTKCRKIERNGMMDDIKKLMKERMDEYNDSREPTIEEIYLCWLIHRVDALEKEIE